MERHRDEQNADAMVGLHIRAAVASDVPRLIELYEGDELRTARPTLAHERDGAANSSNDDSAGGSGDPTATLRAIAGDPMAAFRAIADDPSHQLVVAEVGGAVVGTLQLSFLPYLHHGGCWVAQVEAVQVARETRGQGIGERLMRWAIDRARERGCLRVQLTSQKRRTRAHRFYERLGFVSTHEGMKLYL